MFGSLVEHVVESNSDSPTYTIVDKKKKKNKGKIKEHKQKQDNTSQKCIHPEYLTAADLEEFDIAEKSKYQPSQRQENSKELYAVVHKKSKKCEEEHDTPLLPSHTIESLYTTVQKKPECERQVPYLDNHVAYFLPYQPACLIN